MDRCSMPSPSDGANIALELGEYAHHLKHGLAEIVKVYKDHGISGAKGRNGRPQFDAM
jgi:hypothetical protein